MTHTNEWLCLDEQQLPQASAVISRAFHNDPLSMYVYPDEAERVQKLSLLYSISLRYALHYGEVTTTPELAGAACWLGPQDTTVSMDRSLCVGAMTISFKMGLAAMRRIQHVGFRMQRVHQRCITEPPWYLWVLGVDPSHQGKGIGGALLRAGLARADTASLPCYLETMKAANVPLYQKFGFVLASEGIIPDSNVCMWSMIRPARVHA